MAELIGRGIARTLLVFVIALVVMWDKIGYRPATTFTVWDVAGAAFLFAVVFALGYREGQKDAERCGRGES